MPIVSSLTPFKTKSKALISGFSFCLLLTSGCAEGIPGSASSQNVDTSAVSPALLALTADYEGKTYNYVGLMTYLNCATEKSTLPLIKSLAESSRKDLSTAFASGSVGTAQSALNNQLKRAATAPPDPGLVLSCQLTPVSNLPSPDATSPSDSADGSAPQPPASSSIASDTLRLEVETATKTGGTLKYPVAETRGTGEKIMMFSGGDAGGQATLTLPALKGRYQVQLNWLNSKDSPAMAIKAPGLEISLADASLKDSGSSLILSDLGTFDLNINAGEPMTFTVLGNTTGKGNAWIGLDYISFTAR
jgi:hypothetical protein